MKNIQKFKVILETSNPNIEEVRQKLETKLASWLDNISFISGKAEICVSVTIDK